MRKSSHRLLDYAPGTLAISVPIEGAGSVALDGNGGFYVTGEDEVRKVNADGTIAVSVRGINFAGQGYRGYGGDGGPAIDGVLNTDFGLSVDPAGDLYIADYGNDRIRKVWMKGLPTPTATPTP